MTVTLNLNQTLARASLNWSHKVNAFDPAGVAKRWLSWVAALVCAAALSGCDLPETLGKVGEVIMNPDIPVGELEDRPSELKSVAFVDPGSNTDFFGQPTPLTFTIIALKGPRKFSMMSIEQAEYDLVGTLGEDYLSHATYIVGAGDFIALQPQELDPGTNFLGVIALYADPDGKQWRGLEPMVASGVTYDVLIRATIDGVVIQTNSAL